jgi:predicted dehydrogenase
LEKLRIGIVGAGRMGRIRSLSARAHPQTQVVAVVDSLSENACSLAAEMQCAASTDWQDLLRSKDIDAIVVATPHKYLAPITVAALTAGKGVFCEKPGARNASEAEAVLRAARRGSHPDDSQSNSRVTVGFTLRHYPAIVQARELVASGLIGEPMYIRARYGHGGRPDYNLEWRGDPEMAGGGELLDQGVHLIDLSRWFLGAFEQVFGSIGTFFWGLRQNPPTQDLEDNAFLSLRTATGKTAWLHASWTQWKNLFSFEIYGREGSLEISGLAGHYGPQRLQIARRRPQGGPPDLQEMDFSSDKKGTPQDDVWTREWAAFISRLVESRQATSGKQGSVSACGLDAWETLRIVDAAYESSRSGNAVSLRQEAPTGSSVARSKSGAVPFD